MLRTVCPRFFSFLPLRSFHLSSITRFPVKITMPSLSPTMTEGTIIQWAKKPGDQVSPGDMLCEIQTDKAVVAMETDEEGILAKILVDTQSGTTKVGDIIALIASSDEDWNEVANTVIEATPSAASPASSPAPPAPAPEAVAPSEPPKATTGIATSTETEKMGPAVRGLLETYALSAKDIVHTGPNNQLLKGDVLAYVASNNLKPKPIEVPSVEPEKPPVPSSTPSVSAASSSQPLASFVDIPLTNMRKVIAKRLTESKHDIPHMYIRSICPLDKLVAFRKKMQSEGIKFSINDCIVKACAYGLRMVPELNAISTPSGSCTLLRQVDVSVAVATPAGLITPIVFGADHLPLDKIATRIIDVAARARAGTLQLHDFQGGSFTISNLGMYGIREFTAIINLPQVAILAVGGSQQNVDMVPDLKTLHQFTLTLSIDARFVSQISAARFLSYVTRILGDHPDELIDRPQVPQDIDSFAESMLLHANPIAATA